MKHLQWAAALEAHASTIRTLVLSTGSEWWRQHDYPASLPNCHGPNSIAEAFIPLTTSHDGPDASVADAIHRQCDVFDTKYPAMVRNVVQYLNSLHAFTGRVIIVTSPSGVRGCQGVRAPHEAPADTARYEASPTKKAFWYDSNPQGGVLHPDRSVPSRRVCQPWSVPSRRVCQPWSVPSRRVCHSPGRVTLALTEKSCRARAPTDAPTDSTGVSHTFGRLRVAENTWLSTFQKHAPRLKVAVLNISAMSDARADVRTPDGECAHFCWPGLPTFWAEMMMRFIEQSVYGATDGLH